MQGFRINLPKVLLLHEGFFELKEVKILQLQEKPLLSLNYKE